MTARDERVGSAIPDRAARLAVYLLHGWRLLRRAMTYEVRKNLHCGVAFALASGLFAVACSGDDAGGASSSKPRERERDGADDGGARTESAVAYALMIRDPDDYTDYLMAGAEVPTGSLDTSRGVELSGGNFYTDETSVYYSHFERKTLQRYVVNQDLEIELAGELSLASYEGGLPVFFSATKGWIIDVNDGLLIEFDPSRMEITREIDAPELIREGLVGEASRAIKVGDRILASIAYYNPDFTKLKPDSTVAIALADSDDPVTIVRDERASGVNSSFADNAGNFYAIADGVAGYFTIVVGQTIEPKLLRVKRGANEIDPDYLLDFEELLGAKVVNGLWPLRDTKFVIQAWTGDDSGVLTADDLDVVPGWEWFIVDAETRETTKIEALGPSTTSYSLLRLMVDDQLYLQQYIVEDHDYNKAHIELYRVTEDAEVEKVVESTRGDMRMMARVSIAR